MFPLHPVTLDPDFLHPAIALRPAINGATAFYDFANGTYWGPPVTHTRASEALGTNAAGVWQKYANDMHRTRTDRGMLSEVAATNLNTNYNAPASGSPTTAYTVTGTATVANIADTTALAAIVDPAICTYAIKVDGGASGGAVTVAGAATTAAHSFQLIARRFSGAGTITATLTGAKGSQNITSATYTRIKSENIAAAAGDLLTLTVPASTVLYFVLNQFELGAFCTTPIVVAGAAALRQADQMTIPLPGAINPLAWSVVATVYRESFTTIAGGLLSFGSTLNGSRFGFFGTGFGNGIQTLVIADGVGVANILGGAAISTGAFHNVGASVRQDDFRQFRDGTADGADAAGTPSAPAGTVIGIGWDTMNGSLQPNAWIQKLAIYPADLPQEQIKWLTT
ncbi:MAG: hypothetical protein OEW11_09590 [Nitrospirota bacterium]|nr:hypothetical protein [Nitrospirota bacterium]